MKRNLFVLVFSLLILSFGLANAFDFEVKISGSAVWDDAGTPKIQPGVPFAIDIAGTNYADDGVRNVVVMSYIFTGTDLALPITWGDNPALDDQNDPTTMAFIQPDLITLNWALLFATYTENFDGNLPDLWAVALASGATAGFNAARYGVKIPMQTFGATVALADGKATGEICIESAGDTPLDDAYDWLFDPPEPIFNKTCWTVADSNSSDVKSHNSNQLPKEFGLGQNHPNPFNPSTVIDFALPTASQVTVDIYNVLGQKVKTLVNEAMPAGYYSATWDGSTDNGQSAASGIYFYKIEAGKFQNTKKLMLLK